MARCKISDIASLLGSSVIPYEGDDYAVGELLTDSRSLGESEGTLFFAIPSLTGDGSRYMRPLYDRGVRSFVCRALPADMTDVGDAAVIIVDDPVKALQQVAAASHPDFRGEMVAITGSRGKTTLKECIFQLLEPLCEVVRSPRSYNSCIGVPLSLWEIRPDTDIALIEAGVSKLGEMLPLARCIAPDTVIVTNIGDEHADGFHSIEEKACEKVTLAAYPSVKRVIFNADSALPASTIAQMCAGKELIGWSLTDESATLYIRAGERDESGMRRLDYRFRTAGGSLLDGTLTAILPDSFDLENACHALAFMLARGFAPALIADRFCRLQNTGTRLNVTEGVNGCTLVYDSYTSDVSSLRPALDFISRRPGSSKSLTLIMSDIMHESGDTDLYVETAALLARMKVNRFIGIGEELSAHRNLFAPGSLFFRSVDEMLTSLSTSDFSDETILIKGAPQLGFQRIFNTLEARTHETVLEVNLDAIVRNYNYFRRHLPAGTGMIAMVKASGYGAGSYEIAKTMQDCGAAYVAVAVIDEGIDLRRAGITMPIMVMNPKLVNYRAMFEFSLEPEIYSMEMLADVVREAEKCGIRNYPVHIKLDTGMHRMGFSEKELPALMDFLLSTDRVTPRSTFSHLATADCPDMNDYTEFQLDNFKRLSDYMLQRYDRPILRHVLNSAGILRYPEAHYDMARLGIGLYGVNTLPADMESPLAVVSTLRTVIIAIRDREPGDTIGYGRRGVISRKSRIATIPIGYADGMRRSFGCGRVCVKVNGKDAPTVGNICMDACMIDVTGIDCREGDAVEIFGTEAPIQRLADADGTIPYEILTSVSPRVKRVYYRE